MANVPYSFAYNNAHTSVVHPSTVRIHNTQLAWFYRRYLLQKIISVFDWDLPDAWNKSYFYYTLYCTGYGAVLNTDKFGVIYQGGPNCGLRGFDLYYQPTHAIITNPLLTGIREPQIGVQCELIKMQPDYGGVMDLVDYYADMMALCAESAAVNILNTKLAYVFGCGNKQQAESFKKLFDTIMAGEPAAFVDKNLFDEDGRENWTLFVQNLKQVYIAGDILEDMRKWEMRYDTEIGIPNANTDKKERLITDEVNANNAETYSKVDLWLATMQECCEKVNNMFGTELAVRLRYPMEEVTSDADDIKNDSVRND